MLLPLLLTSAVLPHLPMILNPVAPLPSPYMQCIAVLPPLCFSGSPVLFLDALLGESSVGTPSKAALALC